MIAQSGLFIALLSRVAVSLRRRLDPGVHRLVHRVSERRVFLVGDGLRLIVQLQCHGPEMIRVPVTVERADLQVCAVGLTDVFHQQHPLDAIVHVHRLDFLDDSRAAVAPVNLQVAEIDTFPFFPAARLALIDLARPMLARIVGVVDASAAAPIVDMDHVAVVPVHGGPRRHPGEVEQVSVRVVVIGRRLQRIVGIAASKTIAVGRILIRRRPAAGTPRAVAHPLDVPTASY